jgi:uncharacterized protein
MDKSYALDCAKRYSDAIRNIMDVKKIILFGSFAKGNATADSDIDIAVIVDNIGRDWLKTSQTLYKLRRNIDVSIEPVLLDSKDNSTGFLEEILKTGEVIYQNSKI